MEDRKEINNADKKKRKVLSPLALKEELLSLSRKDLAEKVSTMDEEDRNTVWSILDTDRILEILKDNGYPIPWFSEMSLRMQSHLVGRMDDESAEMLLSSIPYERRKMILQLSGRTVKANLEYQEDEIGSIMTDDFIILSKDLTLDEALEKIRTGSDGKDNIRTIFVEGESGELYGEVEQIDVLRGRKDEKLSEVAMTSFPFVSADAKISKTLEWIRDYNLSAFPVIDDEGKTIGAVTGRELMDTVEREMAEDYRKLASLNDEDKDKGVLASMASRLPWLFLLLFLGMLVSMLIGSLSSLAMGLTLVFSFQSLILDMTGNSGTQTLAVAVRSLSGRALAQKGKARLVRKEAATGVTSGLILGIGTALVMVPYIFLKSGNGITYSIFLALSISSALVLAMTISNTMGATIPIIMDRIGIDPAVASGPLITTLNDLVGASCYYLMVYLVLRIFMGF